MLSRAVDCRKSAKRRSIALSSKSLRRILRLVAHDFAGVAQITIVPLIIGHDIKDVEPQVLRRFDALFDHLRHVALAAPHGKLANVLGTVLLVDRADAQAEDGHFSGVSKVSGQRFTPNLAAAVNTVRPRQGRFGHHWPRIGHSIILAGDNLLVRRIPFAGADRRPAGSEDDALHPRPPRRFENVVRTDNIVVEHILPLGQMRGNRGEVNDDILGREGWLDRIEIGDVSLVTLDAFHRPAVQGAKLVFAFQPAAGRLADQAAHARDEDFLGSHLFALDFGLIARRIVVERN